MATQCSGCFFAGKENSVTENEATQLFPNIGVKKTHIAKKFCVHAH